MSTLPKAKHFNEGVKSEAWLDAEIPLPSLFQPQPEESLLKPPAKAQESNQTEAEAAEQHSQAEEEEEAPADAIDPQLRQQVITDPSTFLQHINQIHQTRSSVRSILDASKELQSRAHRLQAKLRTPHQSLHTLSTDLIRLQLGTELVRRASRFQSLRTRLQDDISILDNPDAQQQDDEDRAKALARAAYTTREMTNLLRQPPPASLPLQLQQEFSRYLPTLTPIALALPSLAASRSSLNVQMEDLLIRGLQTLNVHNLSTALRVASLLDTSSSSSSSTQPNQQNNLVSVSHSAAAGSTGLRTLIAELVRDLSDFVRERVRAGWDTNVWARESGVKASSPYRFRRHGTTGGLADDSSLSAINVPPAFAQVATHKLETLIVQEMSAVGAKVYVLERVLASERLERASSSAAGLGWKPASTRAGPGASDAGAEHSSLVREEYEEEEEEDIEPPTFLHEGIQVLGSKPSQIFWQTLKEEMSARCQNAIRTSGYSAALFASTSTGYVRLLRLYQDFLSRMSAYSDSADHQSFEALFGLQAYHPASGS
ncbi:hypothetical protein OC845_001560 [Tilletia horrida]|nr:hypothetical protein OC845_001560 [Tilletia horrida]